MSLHEGDNVDEIRRPSFVAMLIHGVDPFSVYRCERRLKDIGVSIDRDKLVNHYLVMGQLDTLLQIVASLERGVSAVTAMKSDLLNSTPDSTSNPKLVNPLAWTLLGTVGGAVLFLIFAVTWLVKWPEATNPLDPRAIAIAFTGIVLTSACYAFLGSRYGRKSAAGITMIVVLAVFAAGVKLFGPI